MLENFIEYMWYLLTTPFKRVRKELNKWYVFCKVFGKRFDIVKESFMIAREEGAVATCSEIMLPVHAADRKLTRFKGESAENFRVRIAMHAEVCRLGGLNDGILLAAETIGYDDVEIRTYKQFKGDAERWAEFFLIVNMDVGDERPTSLDILKKTTRKWKTTGAKDNYYLTYSNAFYEKEWNAYRVVYLFKFIFYRYLRTDGEWLLDGSELLDAVVHGYPTRIGFRYRSIYNKYLTKISGAYFRQNVREQEWNKYHVTYQDKLIFYRYLRTDGEWTLDGSEKLEGRVDPERIRWAARYGGQHTEDVICRQKYRLGNVEAFAENLETSAAFRMALDYFRYTKLNGLWELTGSRELDAVAGFRDIRMHYQMPVRHEYDPVNRVEYKDELRETEASTLTGEDFRMKSDYFDYLKLDGLWYLTGSKAMDAQRSSYTVRIE